jgi:hypothetical protein
MSIPTTSWSGWSAAAMIPPNRPLMPVINTFMPLAS